MKKTLAFLLAASTLDSVQADIIGQELLTNGNFAMNDCTSDFCVFKQPQSVNGWNPRPQIEIGNGQIYNSRLGKDRVIELAGNTNTCIEQNIRDLSPGVYRLKYEYAAREGASFDDCQFKIDFNDVELKSVTPCNYNVNIDAIDFELKSSSDGKVQFCGINGENNSIGVVIKSISLIRKAGVLIQIPQLNFNTVQTLVGHKEPNIVVLKTQPLVHKETEATASKTEQVNQTPSVEQAAQTTVVQQGSVATSLTAQPEVQTFVAEKELGSNTLTSKSVGQKNFAQKETAVTYQTVNQVVQTPVIQKQTSTSELITEPEFQTSAIQKLTTEPAVQAPVVQKQTSTSALTTEPEVQAQKLITDTESLVQAPVVQKQTITSTEPAVQAPAIQKLTTEPAVQAPVVQKQTITSALTTEPAVQATVVQKQTITSALTTEPAVQAPVIQKQTTEPAVQAPVVQKQTSTSALTTEPAVQAPVVQKQTTEPAVQAPVVQKQTSTSALTIEPVIKLESSIQKQKQQLQKPGNIKIEQIKQEVSSVAHGGQIMLQQPSKSQTVIQSTDIALNPLEYIKKMFSSDSSTTSQQTSKQPANKPQTLSSSVENQQSVKSQIQNLPKQQLRKDNDDNELLTVKIPQATQESTIPLPVQEVFIEGIVLDSHSGKCHQQQYQIKASGKMIISFDYKVFSNFAVKESTLIVNLNGRPISRFLPSESGKTLEVSADVSQGKQTVQFCTVGSPKEPYHKVSISNLAVSQNQCVNGWSKDLIVNGGFEQNKCTSSWCTWNIRNFAGKITGWEPSSQIEIGKGNIYNPVMGSSWISELAPNANSCIRQKVSLNPGNYQLKFDWAGRSNIKFDSLEFQAKVNGKVLKTLKPKDYKLNKENIEFEFTETVPEAWVEFCETGRNDSYGALLDNVQMFRSEKCATTKLVKY